MLRLDHKLDLDEEAIKAPNLSDRYEKADLDRIGGWCRDGFTQDQNSRAAWVRRTEAGMDLAMQIQKDKSFPWPGCSNIAFPIITIATMQFHARAYPTLVSGTSVVKCRVIGDDPDGQKTARAERISCHMSYQVLEEDRAWEEQQDRTLINVPVVGTAWKKSYFSASRGHNISELVMAKDFVLDYFAKSTEACPRKTHVVPLSRNDIHERVLRGVYRDVLGDAWYQTPPTNPRNTQEINADNRQGVSPSPPDETTPFFVCEQHVDLDLDQDGYAEPYIITFERQTGEILRIATRFDRPEDIERVSSGTRKGQIIRVSPMEYFTKVPFIPSPDGGIYDIGFGVLLGPLNESVNTIVNQLTDAGTMQTTAGGFLGRGAKIRGGVYTFQPFGWNRVDSTGDDLRKSIFPLPINEPSAVLFQLLSLLINYTQRISGTTDAVVGENPGQNTPAYTQQSMVEQGQKIYSALFKRIWRATKEEFKKLYILNGIYMEPGKKAYGSAGGFAMREDYLGDPDAVCPEADPNITSEGQALQQATALKASAMQTPGYDVEAVEKRYLAALKIDGIDQVYGGLKKFPPPGNPELELQGAKDKAKMELESLKNQSGAAKLELEKMKFIATLLEEQRLNAAKITEMQANATKLLADIQGDQEDREINAVNAMIGIAKHHNDVLQGRIDLILKGLDHDRQVTVDSTPDEGRMGRVAGTSNDGVVAALGGMPEGGAQGAMGGGILQ